MALAAAATFVSSPAALLFCGGGTRLLLSARPDTTSFNIFHSHSVRSYSTQFDESSHVSSHESRSQAPHSPPITGDTSTGSGAHVSDGRSSQTTSTTVAGDVTKALVARVLQIYECRSLEEQRRLINELYSPDAIYENNVAMLTGRGAIVKGLALLPVSTSSVRVEYDNPVVLGATTSAPEALDNLSHKGELQVEVTNKQHYRFDRSHSLWRSILLPRGDPELSVLTRLTLSRSEPHKVLYHQDQWMHENQWLGPLKRCWGVVEQAAAGTAAAAHGSNSSSSSSSSH